MNATATANPVLTTLVNKFTQDPKTFVAPYLFPTFYAGEQSADYYVFDAENLLDVPRDISRAPSAAYKRMVSKLSDDTYNCKEFGIEEPVDDRERKKYSKSFDADKAAAMRIGNVLLLNREFRARAKALTIPNTASPGTKWDAGGTPIADVDVAKEVIHNACGMDPNLLVLPRNVFNCVKRLAAFIDLVKYTQKGVMTEDLLAELFGVDRVVVAGGIENKANEGQAVNPGQIWVDDVVLAHVDPSQDLKAVNFGRTFAWTGETGGGDNLALVESYRDEEIRSDVHRGRHDVDEKITGSECAYLLSNVLGAI